MNNKTNKVVALLPMKGESERVPKKNLKNFCGRPLYHYTMNSLIESEYIEKIIVNTDCSNIIDDINNNFSDHVIINRRPKGLIGNYVSMNDIIKHDISSIESEIFIQTHATNPLLMVDSINNAILKMIKFNSTKEFDSIFSVTEIRKRFYDRKSNPLNHDTKMLVTQHLDPIFEENSCLYVFTKKSFEKNNNRIGVNPHMFKLDKIESIDIDEKEDFAVAESLFKLFR